MDTAPHFSCARIGAAPGRLEQFALIVFRVSGDRAAAANVLDRFNDKENASSWASDALAWAVTRALLLGDDTQMLRPRDGITRTEAAAILERWLTEP